MKTYEVTIEVESQTLSLSQIDSIVGTGASAFSHNRGDLRGRESRWESTVWKTVPLELGDPSISAAIEQLLLGPAAIAIRTKRAALGEIDAFINIAVFHQSCDCSLVLEKEALRQIGETGLDLAVSCYPCE